MVCQISDEPLRRSPMPSRKDKRDRKIFDMWLACYTQEEIAADVNLSQPQSAEVIKNIGIGNLAKSDKSAAEHASDFTPPIYNIWKQQDRST